MANKIKQIIDAVPAGSILFGSWLTAQGLDAKAQYDYLQNGWLERISKGVYKIAGSQPTIYAAVSSYNTQLGRECLIGAYSALELRGYSHYVPMGKPKAYLFAGDKSPMPKWMKDTQWDATVCYTATSFLREGRLGIETMSVDGFDLPVSSPERAILECLYFPAAKSSLLDIYYIMEGLTTLRPKLLQQLLENCHSVKVKRLFLYMAEKAAHPWFNALDTGKIDIGSGRRMISATGKYISKYNMTVPNELADYE